MQILTLNSSYYKQVSKLIKKTDSNFSWSNKQILQSLNNDLVLGVTDNLELKAVSIFSYILDTSELLYICIQKDNQSQGLAYMLLEKAIEVLKSKKVREIFLEVDALNTKAINLYHKLGFKYISTRKGYYKRINGSFSDALIYQLYTNTV